MRASPVHVVLTIAPLLLAALPQQARPQSRDTLLSALREPLRAGFAPLVPAAPGHQLLLRPDRVFDASGETAHAGDEAAQHRSLLAR